MFERTRSRRHGCRRSSHTGGCLEWAAALLMIPLANTVRCPGCKGGRGDGERGELRHSERLGFELEALRRGRRWLVAGVR